MQQAGAGVQGLEARVEGLPQEKCKSIAQRQLSDTIRLATRIHSINITSLLRVHLIARTSKTLTSRPLDPRTPLSEARLGGSGDLICM